MPWWPDGVFGKCNSLRRHEPASAPPNSIDLRFSGCFELFNLAHKLFKSRLPPFWGLLEIALVVFALFFKVMLVLSLAGLALPFKGFGQSIHFVNAVEPSEILNAKWGITADFVSNLPAGHRPCETEGRTGWLIAKGLQQFTLTQKGNAMVTRFIWMSDRIRHTIFVCVQ